MAQNYKYNKNTTEKFTIKGELSENGKVITYVNADKQECRINVDTCFAKFCGEPIELTIAVKIDEDLSDEFED